MTQRVVVIGGDAAGMSAASQAKRLSRRRPGDRRVRARAGTSYSACGIPYWVGGDVDDGDALIARTPEEHRANGHRPPDAARRSIGIDLDGARCAVRDLGGRAGRTGLGFDQLVIATGARPLRPDVPGIDAAGVYGVQTLDDGEALLDGLDAATPRAGGRGRRRLHRRRDGRGDVSRGLEVTVVDRRRADGHPRPGHGRAWCTRRWRAWASTSRTSARRRRGSRPAPDGRVRAVVTDERRATRPTSWCSASASRPRPRSPRRPGCRSGGDGGLPTDLRMRVRDARGRLGGRRLRRGRSTWSRGAPVHIPLGTHANKQGRVAGTNIGGGYATFPGVVGTAVTKVCDLEIARTGLREQDADAVGLRYVTVDASSRRPGPATTPGAEPITVKMIAERRTGRLLGAQIVGREGAAKRIDVAGGRAVERDDGRGDVGARPRLRAAVLAGLGPGPDRRPQGGRRGARRLSTRVGLGVRERSARSDGRRTRHGMTPIADSSPPSRRPPCPIATPEVYAEMLDRAKAGAFAYPAINVTSLADAERRAARLRRGRQRRHRPGLHRRRGVPVRRDRQGHGARRAGAGRVRARRGARHYPVNIALHTDHCPKDKLDGYMRPLIAICQERVAEGREPLFQSHMWDGSAVELEENLEIAQELLEECAAAKIVMEIEIGVVGGEEDGVANEINEKLYTTAEDALRTAEVLGTGEKGRYLLAATFGNVHGVYKPGNVKLRPAILKEIQDGGRREGRQGQAVRPGLPRRLRLAAGGDPRGARLRRREDERRHRHPVRLHPADRRPHVPQLRRRAEGRRRGRQQEAVRPARLRQGGRGRHGRPRRRGLRGPALGGDVDGQDQLAGRSPTGWADRANSADWSGSSSRR